MIIFRSSVSERQQKINFNKLKNQKCDHSRFSAECFNKELSEVEVIANGTICVSKLFSSFYNKYYTIVKQTCLDEKII